ncbi:MAG: gliding motility-associated C-terminal domain-containing protein [Saprospiraceae bacterium]|nr:gliding motility-associated C-terminal domain-containing protein [Saprospiraceae bacterium]
MKADTFIFILKKGIIRILSILSFFLFFIHTNYIHATHIVGGQLSYRNLGKNQFEISIIFRRDCINGADTVPFDNPALLGVFYGDNQKAFRIGFDGVIPIKQTVDDTLTETIDNFCVDKFKEVCVHQTIYRDTVQLPFDERGYILVYQRCCRNTTLANIVDPLETGATYTAQITAKNLIEGNSNPLFGSFPPIYACANKPFTFDHGAIDSDGDSLVYTLCAPYLGKTRLDPAGRPSFPPYDTVTWKSPFNINNLFGSPLTINPNTGLIEGTPPILGQFLVGVCVYEYRKGQLIGYARRDFELNIVPCGIKPVAAFDKTSALCDGLQQSFKNNSIDGINYQWFFDWQNDKSLQSTATNPVFKYSKAGIYEVILIAKNGECDDTARLNITVIDPQLKAAFDFQVDCINKLRIQISNTSTANSTIINYNWTLIGTSDSLRSNLKDPVFNLNGDGKITINLIITDENGCTSSITKELFAKIIDIDLIANETKICNGDSTKLVRNPNGNFNYQWSPTSSLDLRNPSDPIARPNITTTYTVTITDGLCSLIKQIKVIVLDKVKVEISGDTIVCNGSVELNAKSDSTSIFVWSKNSNFNPILFSGNKLLTTISGSTRFYVQAGSSEQCKDTSSILVTDRSVKLSYTKEKQTCTGDTFELDLKNLNSSDILSVKWDSNAIILSALDVLNPIISITNPGRYVLHFTTKNQYGCVFNDSIIIIAVFAEIPEFTFENICGSLEVKVSTNAIGNIHWDFGDGKGSGILKTMIYKYEKAGRYTITLETDSICLRSTSKEIVIVELKATLEDSVIACLGQSVALNPGGNTSYKYKWSPSEGLSDSTIANPIATVSVSSKFFVIISDPNFSDACSIKDSICVVVPPKIILSSSPDTILCEPVLLTLKSNANLTNIKIQWCDENNKSIGDGPQIQVTPGKTTFYIIKAIDSYDCETRDTIHVTIFELKAEISGNHIICKGNQTQLKATARPDSMYTYEWSPKQNIIGSNTDSIVLVNPTETTTFNVIITNGKGCRWERSFTVEVNDLQKDFIVSADPTKIVPGQKSQLIATFDPTWKYIWKPNDGSLSDSSIFNPVANPNKTTTYTVTATDQNGCTATGIVTIVVTSCEEAVFIPNAFSPNQDTKNDILFVRARASAITKIELIIYSRWGERVFSTNDINIGWDGRFNGKILTPDVFGYGLKYKCIDNQEYIKKGNISLLK